MASLFKPTRPYPLPPAAEVLDRGGRPHVLVTQKGRPALYPLSRDRIKFLKPSAKWYGKYRDAAGGRQVVPLSPNKTAAQAMLNDLVRNVENEKVGIRDPFEAHRKKPLAAHLADWLESLRANGRDPEYLALKAGRVRPSRRGANGCSPAT